ncbi:MAG: hypothetical protein AAB947_01695 [Patescibacteria group bacterium]
MQTKVRYRTAPTVQNLVARRAVLARMRGMWKGARGKEIIREMRDARKSWDHTNASK